MGYLAEIQEYCPVNGQEEADKKTILAYIDRYGNSTLYRDNTIAHLTSSAFVLNEECTQVLLAHHNILGKWAWLGGHLDGREDMRAVALQELAEETGVVSARPLAPQIASIDILPVGAHTRKGEYVHAHLHLSVAYLFVCRQEDAVRSRQGENTDVAWFGLEYFAPEHFNAYDVYLYQKLLQKALRIQT